MKNFLKFLNNLLTHKYTKLILSIVVLIILIYTGFSKNKINKKKIEETITKYKKIEEEKNKQVTKEKIVNNKESVKQEKIEKKQIVSEKITKKDLKKENELKIITNTFLKIEKLNTYYNLQLKERKINKKGIVKRNDYVYYSLEAIFDGIGKRNPKSYLYIKIGNDAMSKKLINKKINQVISFNYMDLLDDENRELAEQLKQAVSNFMEKLNKKYNSEIFNSKNIIYVVEVLDIIPQEIVKNLNLDK